MKKRQLYKDREIDISDVSIDMFNPGTLTFTWGFGGNVIVANLSDGDVIIDKDGRYGEDSLPYTIPSGKRVEFYFNNGYHLAPMDAELIKEIEAATTKPTYLNTGMVNPAMLQAAVGRQRLRLAIEAIEYLDIVDGYISYEKDGGRIYNNHIKPQDVIGIYGIQEVAAPTEGWSGLLVEDCELGGGDYNFQSAAIIGHGWTMRRCYIHQSNGDGIKAQGNNVIEDCFITDLGRNTADSHADGMQMTQGKNVACRRTFFDMPVTPNNLSNACVMIKSSDGDVEDVDIDGCYFKGTFTGPNNVIYLYEENGFTIRGVKIRNCIFEVGLNPLHLLAILGNPEYEWTNNMWSDGTPIPDPFA